MNDEIGYEEGEMKITPKIQDAEIQKLRNESIKKLEKAQVDKQVRAEAGLTEIPKEPESIPKELPKMVFKLGAKVIACEKFNLDEEESKVLAKHLSILIGAISSKWYSAIIIIIIVISKISDCFTGIKKMLKREKKEKTEETELAEQGRPHEIDTKGKIYG